MKPIKFPEQTKELKKPDSMSEEECMPLPVWNGDKEQCISCWKGGFKERLKFLFTGKMWVGVLSGITQPPIWITPNHPFEKQEKSHGH